LLAFMSRSSRKLKPSSIFFAKSPATRGPSPTLTASTAKRRASSERRSRSMLGISSRQGAHQVAQKFTSSTRPR